PGYHRGNAAARTRHPPRLPPLPVGERHLDVRHDVHRGGDVGAGGQHLPRHRHRRRRAPDGRHAAGAGHRPHRRHHRRPATMAARLLWPRRVLIAAALPASAAVGLFVLGLATGVTSFPLLLALTAVLGATSTVAASAFFTHLNSLRPRHLAEARAKMQTVDSVVGMGASASAGPLIAAFGPLVALVTDAVSYLLSAGWLRSISAPDHNPARDAERAATPIRRDLAEGVQLLLRSRLRPVVGYMLLAQAAFTGVAALKAIFILR